MPKGRSGIITEEFKGKENTAYHDVEKLFKIYRSVNWKMQIKINQVKRHFQLEYGTDVDKFLDSLYQAGMDVDTDLASEKERVESINHSVSGEVSNAGEGLGSEIMSALQGNGVSSVNQEKGILDEVGTSSVFGFDAAPRAGMNYNENSMPTGMESMSENGIQSDGIMDTGEDLDEETDEADFYAKSAMGILVDTAGNPLKAENTKLSDPGVQNEDDIQPTADETGMTADGFMNVSGSIPTGDISLKRSRPDTRRIREVPKSRAELKENGDHLLYGSEWEKR